MNAIVLAGAPNSGPLRHLSSARYEAGIEVAGRPMLDYVIMALASVAEIEKIIIVGHEASFSPELRSRVYRVVEPGDSQIDSLLHGLESLDSDQPVLAIGSDVPLVTPEALRDFIKRCYERRADLYYSYVSKDANEQKYPGVRRTYVRIKEGTFTGGNLVLLSPSVIGKNVDLLRKAAMLRKKPFKLIQMLGWTCLIRFMLGNLTVNELEERASAFLQFNAITVLSPYPEIGIDIDKPSDLQLAREALLNRG